MYYDRLKLSLFVMLFTSPIVVALGVYNYFQDRDIVAHGQTTLGTVSSEFTERNESASPSQFLVVDYTVDGKNYRNNFQVDANQYSTHPTGSRIKVHYLPSNPNSAMLGKSLFTSVGIIVAGTVMFLISLVYHLHRVRKKAAVLPR